MDSPKFILSNQNRLHYKTKAEKNTCQYQLTQQISSDIGMITDPLLLHIFKPFHSDDFYWFVNRIGMELPIFCF